MIRIVLLLAALVLVGAASPDRAQMKALYEENLRLAKQTQDLERSLAEIEAKIAQARSTLANYEYVYAQNAQQTPQVSSCPATQETGK